jgi:hypothetical protein
MDGVNSQQETFKDILFMQRPEKDSSSKEI